MANEIRILSQARSGNVEVAVDIGRDSIPAANRFLDAMDETLALLGGARSEPDCP